MQLTGPSALAIAVFAFVAGFAFALGTWLANKIVSRP
jgi:hypothetical protein